MLSLHIKQEDSHPKGLNFGLQKNVAQENSSVG